MCDQGYDVLFKAKNCQIKFACLGEVVVEVVRTNSNVYVLKEKTERCCLSKIDESCLWHGRLAHLNFD